MGSLSTEEHEDMNGKRRKEVPPRALRVRGRTVAAVAPVALLAATGVALAAGDSAPAPRATGSTQEGTPDVTVPPRSVVEPASPPGPFGMVAPALELPAGTQPGSAAPVSLDGPGIPSRALTAYERAAQIIDGADPACGIDWALVAAIGRVESDHARFGGNGLDAGGRAVPGIIGIPLDGSRGTAVIRDSDGGRLDGDATYDRAVGPMQFIPGTWRTVGSDADADGAKDPQDIDDAATATAVYLCSGPGDLTQPGDLDAAVRRYNNSGEYVRTVTAIAAAYRQGVRELPASALPAAHPAGTYARAVAGTAPASRAATPAPSATSSRPAPSSSASPTGPSRPQPTKAPAPRPTTADPVTPVVDVVTSVVKVPVPVRSTSCALVTSVPVGVLDPVVSRVCTTSTTTTTTARTTTSTVTR